MGTIAIDSGLVRLPGMGGTYRDVSLLSTIDERTLVIERATAFSGEGSLRGSGRIDFSDIDTLRQNLRFTVQDFLAIQNPTVKATLSGNLNIGGTLTDPVVTGDIEVKDSYFIVPEESGGGTVEAVDLTEEDYDMLARNFAVAQRPAAEEENGVSPSPLRPTLDINLSMGRNTWVRKRMNPKIAIELLGNIAVTSRPDQPLTIFGILRPKTGRSFVGQFGREFEIREGEIAFNGPPEDLELRIESEYKVPSASGSGLSEVVIRMGVESKLGRFTFRLSSDPAMEEADILSYLATGKAHTGALARTGDQGNLGSAAALEQLVGAAGGLTEGKIPLDVFQIRQDGARGITIVAGNYPTPRTYLGIRQPILINQGTLDTYYDVRTQFEVEYQASSWLFFNFQGGSSRTLLLLKSRYAY
jgi:autotransporter translocation and assembly factor TamB